MAIKVLKIIHRIASSIDSARLVGTPVFLERLQEETGLTRDELREPLDTLFRGQLIKSDASGRYVSLTNAGLQTADLA